MVTASVKLRAIKIVHTVAWAFFAAAILLIPLAAWRRAWPAAMLLIGIVTFECVILLFNHMRCPLTPLAGRYTSDRADNFDIYLPLWLARYNKQIFGSLFAAGILFTLLRRFVF